MLARIERIRPLSASTTPSVTCVAFSTPCFSPSLHRHSTFSRSRDANASWFSYHFVKAATTFANESLPCRYERFFVSCKWTGIHPLKKWRMDHCKSVDIRFVYLSENSWQSMCCPTFIFIQTTDILAYLFLGIRIIIYINN